MLIIQDISPYLLQQKRNCPHNVAANPFQHHVPTTTPTEGKGQNCSLRNSVKIFYILECVCVKTKEALLYSFLFRFPQ